MKLIFDDDNDDDDNNNDNDDDGNNDDNDDDENDDDDNGDDGNAPIWRWTVHFSEHATDWRREKKQSGGWGRLTFFINMSIIIFISDKVV